MPNALEIEDIINDFKTNHAGADFEFRKGQKEAIISIIQTFLEKTRKHYFLQAPTGAGKSIIGICVAYVLNKLGFNGYILASDISLQTQYENDFKRLHLNWGSIKGIDNYLCSENGEIHSLGNCHMRLETIDEISQRKCFKECEYYKNRTIAANSPTALLNYSYWLIQQNYVNTHCKKVLFETRDFIICDEAHKLLDIVQNHFAPKIDQTTLKKFKDLEDVVSQYVNYEVFNRRELTKIINGLLNERNKERLFVYISQFEMISEALESSANDNFKPLIAKQYKENQIPNYLKKYLHLCEWIKDIHCKFEDYCDIINASGLDYLVACRNEEAKEVTFKTLDEKYLMQNFFHNVSGFSVMMTATMGAPKTFYKKIKGTKLENGRALSIPSTFDFTKSPIYVYPSMSMSYKNKEKNTPKIIEKINDILNEHKNQNGIIHCGSYELGKKIYNSLSDKSRIIAYESGEKSDSLLSFGNANNSVLMGPSILEGINLDEDKSRFQIFAKVPYASLADEYVSAKLKIDPEWYQTEAIIKILQGVGRSVRSETDWAITYILDSDFIRLWKDNKEQFPKEFNDRLVFMY